MATHHLLVLDIFFFLTGLSGIQSVSTVSHVTVKKGGSITIPCLYDQRYRNHVKYWCKGRKFLYCSTQMRTKPKSTSDWLSISDNVTTSIFTLTMNNLQPVVSDYFWCAVEKFGPDEKTYLSLSVTTGTPGLYVDQQHVTGVEGQSVTVNCSYINTGDMRWCRMGGSCVKKSETLDAGASVKLKRISTNGKKVMIVTMSGLDRENTGWYWCAVGDLQMPVHITVNQKTIAQSTTTITTTTYIRTTKAPTTHQTSVTGAESNTSQPTVTPSVTDQNNGGTDEKRQERIQSLLVVLLIPLSLLGVVIAGTLVTWKMLRKHKDKKAKGQPPNTSVQSADPEQEITYSTVSHIRGATQQGLNPERHVDLYSTVIPMQHRKAQRQDPFPDDAVTYSTLVTKNKTQPNAAEPDDVVYSTVAPHQR
ncbi:polymeric immunoglobulin receptor isoform X2 [Coregonus clupeaformis]|uniref:polymeric immunoglobulin receptor isoform X2 n=1 Tax=Coregonus clupeaformis TaxID=59861 RepID=UPI001BE09A0D|nr:polymeric immunoglobulin receptor isoform X2 [Coregonus clupeaformis]